MAFRPSRFQQRNRERRTQIFWVDPDCLLYYLSSMEKWPQCFGRAIIEGLPEDAEIEDVRWNDDRRCFGALVYSASYPIVPDGEMTPIGGGGYLDMRYGWFNRQADGSYRSTDDKQQAFSDLTKQTTMSPEPAGTIELSWGSRLPRITQCYGLDFDETPLQEGESIYDGPHLHAALKCYAVGYRENAVSWMARDIGEVQTKRDDLRPFNAYTDIDPNSLRLTRRGLMYRLVPPTPATEKMAQNLAALKAKSDFGERITMGDLKDVIGYCDLPASVVEGGQGRSFQAVESEAEFFRKSILAE